ncbi:MAG: radical SAM protein [Candidatus Scalindua sp.]|jgi:radical SAM protein with 4Fe4S-binding SPASM domain|nr:radical SAM protein [Candidatus Scalindua sp.]MBT6229823.1 radical SAM protein [Candidatus Scalindua sp.]
MNKQIVDKSVVRKGKLVQQKERLRLIDGFLVFTLVEINIYGACNRSCRFCPVSDPTFYTNKHEGITVDLYTKIMTDLSRINYDGTILFSAFSEPFLNKDLSELVRITKNILPSSHLEIVSNGDIIKKRPNKLVELFKKGLDAVSISIYDSHIEFNEFAELRTRLNLSNEQLILRRRYFEENNVDFGMFISNRTGLVDSNEYRTKKEDKITELPLTRACFYPFYQMLVDYNGDMIICPHDWGKKYIIGNLAKENIWDLWTSRKYETARKSLSEKNRNFQPCNTCDVYGDIFGSANYEMWKVGKGR